MKSIKIAEKAMLSVLGFFFALIGTLLWAGLNIYEAGIPLIDLSLPMLGWTRVLSVDPDKQRISWKAGIFYPLICYKYLDYIKPGSVFSKHQESSAGYGFRNARSIDVYFVADGKEVLLFQSINSKNVAKKIQTLRQIIFETDSDDRSQDTDLKISN